MQVLFGPEKALSGTKKGFRFQVSGFRFWVLGSGFWDWELGVGCWRPNLLVPKLSFLYWFPSSAWEPTTRRSSASQPPLAKENFLLVPKLSLGTRKSSKLTAHSLKLIA